jgi:hypothetical protein
MLFVSVIVIIPEGGNEFVAFQSKEFICKIPEWCLPVEHYAIIVLWV